MTNILWFSRHSMTDSQLAALTAKFGDVTVHQINKTINSAFELQDEIAANDVIAIVAPLNLQAQFLKLAGDKPVITAETRRELVRSADGGEDKVNFVFNGWTRLVKIDVVTEPFV